MTIKIHVNRNARLLAVGGLAVGAGFGASSVLAASSNSNSNSNSAAQTATSRKATVPPGPGEHGDHGRGRHGHGGGGTITAISGSSLTLRTEPGTETVTTDSATSYIKEHAAIHFADLHVGDVVHVKGTPSSGSTPASGTIAATVVTVTEPSLGGRVQSVSGDTYSLVGRDGVLLTITVTGSTHYYSAGQSSNRAAITPGSHVHAEGRQDSLTHLTADDVVLDPPPPPPPGG